MLRVAAARLLQAVPVLFGVSIAVFLMIHLIPGDPARLAAGDLASPADVENVRHALGLDRSLPVQYATFLFHALTGSFGTSFRTGRPVITEIGPRYLATLELGGAALVFSITVGVLAGVIAAVRRLSWVDNAVLLLSTLSVSIPSFALGLGLMLIFSVWLGWLPLSGGDTWASLVLPTVTLGLASVAVVARIMRGSLADVLDRAFVQTARAKGVRESLVIWKHAVRNALIPVITVGGLQLGYLLGGAVITETVFAWPGLGRLLVQSILARDFPVVQASVLLLAGTFVLINLATDLTYAAIDPRLSVA